MYDSIKLHNLYTVNQSNCTCVTLNNSVLELDDGYLFIETFISSFLISFIIHYFLYATNEN